MDTETKITINFLETYPRGLKLYLQKRYGRYIDKLIKKISNFYNEPVAIHYTFEGMKPVWACDLDFYFVNNKSKYPLGDAGNRKLPVCFVIMAPIQKTPSSDDWKFGDEGVYIVQPFEKNTAKWLYRKKVNNISWERLFKEALKSKEY